MTPSEFDGLDDREVDALIAEKVMGWEKVVDPDGEVRLIHATEANVPHYSTDLNACSAFESQFVNSGSTRWVLYIISLRNISGYYDTDMQEAREIKIVSATARQKCKAALMAVGVVKSGD